MKILVTGSEGFVGKETVKLLEKEGHEVVGYDLMNGFDICDKKQFDYICGGLKWDYNFIEKTVTPEFKPKVDKILHLAAIARFSDADADPKLAFETNVLGTKNVAEIAAKYHIPLVYASTGSVYMPITEVPEKGIDETLPGKGNSIYGCTKYMGELYVKQNTPHIILRYAHLYGKEKRGHGLIGGFIQRIERGIAPTLYGGQQSNDFTYIKDVARANVCALTASWDKWNQIYNIGTGEEISAENAGKIICKAYGYKGDIEVKEGRTVDASHFVYNTKKAEVMLGFKAKYSFEDGLKDMVNEQ